MSVIEDVSHPDRSGFANEPLNAPIKDIPLTKDDIAIGMKLEVQSKNVTVETEPIFLIKGNLSSGEDIYI